MKQRLLSLDIHVEKPLARFFLSFQSTPRSLIERLIKSLYIHKVIADRLSVAFSSGYLAHKLDASS